MVYDGTVYNAYLVDAGEQTLFKGDYDEPSEWGILVDIVIAKSRGSARYHLWKRYWSECFLDNIHETKMTTKLIAYDVKGPARCVGEDVNDPAYILWHSKITGDSR